jgi:hypothetical protein
MKRLLIFGWLCGMAAVAAGEPLSARIKYDGTKVLVGTVEGRGGGSVIIRPQGQSPARMPESRLVEVFFRLDGMAGLSSSFEQKEYAAVADAAGRILQPALEYVDLPGNLPEQVRQWMIASFWTGDYSRTADLAKTLRKLDNESLRDSANLYGRLAAMEQGATEGMKEFMETPEADQTFPEGSAARLYIEARLLQRDGKPSEAAWIAGRMIAEHRSDADWMPRAELLCAELYFELDMPESADAVLEDIRYFYKDNEEVQGKAAELAAKQE